MDTLDYQSAFLAGIKVEIIMPDGTTKTAECEEDIANLDSIAIFKLVE